MLRQRYVINMAKVNQNKLIGALAVAVITLIVVIVIVVIAKELFPANTRSSSSTVLGTDTYGFIAATQEPAITTTPSGGDDDPSVTTTPSDDSGSQSGTAAPSDDNTTTTTTAESTSTTTTTSQDTSQNGATIYLNTAVYLRSAADWNSTKGVIIGVGESATVVGIENGWYILDYQGQRGYVYQDYISQSPV